MRRFGKIIEDLDAENTEGDNREGFRGRLYRNITGGMLENLLDSPKYNKFVGSTRH